MDVKKQREIPVTKIMQAETRPFAICSYSNDKQGDIVSTHQTLATAVRIALALNARQPVRSAQTFRPVRASGQAVTEEELAAALAG